MPIRAIAFDFGNVVGFFDHWLTTNRLACHSSLPPAELHAVLFGGTLEQDYDAGRTTMAEFLTRVREAGKLSCSDDEVRTAWADIFWPNQDVCALLPRLKSRYRLLLASNTNDLHAKQFLGQFRHELSHFHALVLSYQIGYSKPQAEFFDFCRRSAGCAAEECLFIDDLPANVAGAQASGWNAIVYTGIADLQTRLAVFGI
jgi:glucose-1-phosphatase